MDAFVEVKESFGTLQCTQSFFRDLCLTYTTSFYLQRKYGLPAKAKAVKFLTSLESLSKKSEEVHKNEEDVVKFPEIPAEELVREFGLSENAVAHWLCWLQDLSTIQVIHRYAETAEDGEVDKSKVPLDEHLQEKSSECVVGFEPDAAEADVTTHI